MKIQRMFLVPILIMLCSWILLTQIALAEKINKSLPTKGLKHLVIHNDEGDVQVFTRNVEEAKIVAELKRWDGNCQFKAAAEGESLNITARKTEKHMFGANHNCEVKIEVELPPRFSAELHLGNGDVHIIGLQDSVDCHIGNGKFLATELKSPKLDLSIGNGNSKIHGNIENCEIQVGNGSVDLHLSAPLAAKGLVEMNIGNGNGKICLPKNSKVAVEFSTGLGQSRNELGNFPNSPFKIEANTGVGQLAVVSE